MTLNWNHLAPVERAERFTGAWDGAWFEEDYCEGPGQALIVNPRGEVAGNRVAASRPTWISFGRSANIYHDTVETVIRRGREHPYVGKVFREGLTAIRDEILARDPDARWSGATTHAKSLFFLLVRADHRSFRYFA